MKYNYLQVVFYQLKEVKVNSLSRNKKKKDESNFCKSYSSAQKASFVTSLLVNQTL